MSTRSSVYYEDGGIHIFHDFMDRLDTPRGQDLRLHLEYCQGAFSVEVVLSKRLGDIILLGLQAEAGLPPEEPQEKS